MKETRDKTPIEKDEKGFIKNCRFRKVSNYTISVSNEKAVIIETNKEMPIEKPSE
jgi:hypothetical protein